MSRPGPFHLRLSVIGAAAVFCVMLAGQSAPAFDPFASSNGLYPDREDYGGPLRVSNLDYRSNASHALSAPFVAGQPITTATAPDYLAALKRHLTPSLMPLVNDGSTWSPKEQGWYDMIWLGEGEDGAGGSVDPSSGRESISGTYTGQIVPRTTFLNRYGNGKQGPLPKGAVQNHAVIYYNAVAARMLSEVWRDPYAPDLSALTFPDGSISVKIEAVTPDVSEWEAVRGASTWKVYRPSVADLLNPPKGGAQPQVLDTHPLQMSIMVKDSTASPDIGWIFAAFVYDADALGETPWDRFVPVGAQWGNDPQLARQPDGNGGSPANLTQTWFNAEAPLVAHGTLGWGGRLAGPMDVATRANTLSTSGNNLFARIVDLGASSCASCHMAAEFPWSRNLYPAPNRSFPRDGQPFVLFEPGSEEWARWFQNRRAPRGVSNSPTIQGLDYDFAIMFALGVQGQAVGNPAHAFSRFSVH